MKRAAIENDADYESAGEDVNNDNSNGEDRVIPSNDGVEGVEAGDEAANNEGDCGDNRSISKESRYYSRLVLFS